MARTARDASCTALARSPWLEEPEGNQCVKDQPARPSMATLHPRRSVERNQIVSP